MKKGILLIGMPGSGKTTISCLLQKKINCQLYDIDNILKNHLFLTNHKECEQNYLLNMIEKVTSDIVKKTQYIDNNFSIISPTGNIVYFENIMKETQHLLKIYLKVDLEVLFERTENYSNKHLTLQNNNDINSEYLFRNNLYTKYADIIILNSTDTTYCINEILNIIRIDRSNLSSK